LTVTAHLTKLSKKIMARSTPRGADMCTQGIRNPTVLALIVSISLVLPQTVHTDTTASEAENTPVRIGVLAHRGAEAAIAAWQPTAEFLTRTVGREFHIVPLNNTTLPSAVAEGQVHFVITNPGSYAELELNYGVTRMLTLRNLREGEPYTRFGAVIFTRADRTDIRTLQDLRGKSFAGVRADAFGGYQMALLELRRAGINPDRDFSRLAFSGLPQDQIVLAVRDREVDAGTVRTDTLERMASEGLIALEDFRILNPQAYPDFPFVVSTRLYPEWAFARTGRVHDQLGYDVGLALLQLTPDSPEARASQSAGWTVPLDYTPAHELLRELRAGPYKDIDRIDLGALLEQYWYWFLLMLAGFALLITVGGYILHMNRRLHASQDMLMGLTRELEESNRVLQQLSAQDGLTGLANHRHFEEVFAREWARCARDEYPISLLMADIDHFKRFNDRYGHPAGDQCLRRVAATLRGAVRRPADLVARYGGEEFAIILPGTDASGAYRVAERARAAVEALLLEHNEGGQTSRVTVSVGACTMVPNQDSPHAMLIAAADAALYCAKDQGRNCVVVHEERDTSATGLETN